MSMYHLLCTKQFPFTALPAVPCLPGSFSDTGKVGAGSHTHGAAWGQGLLSPLTVS